MSERKKIGFAIKTNDLNDKHRQNTLNFICFIQSVKQKAISAHLRRVYEWYMYVAVFSIVYWYNEMINDSYLIVGAFC